jgi:hypothetical protein
MVTSWPLLEIAGGTSRTFELRPTDRDEVEAQSGARSIGIEPRGGGSPVNAHRIWCRVRGSWSPIQALGLPADD